MAAAPRIPKVRSAKAEAKRAARIAERKAQRTARRQGGPLLDGEGAAMEPAGVAPVRLLPPSARSTPLADRAGRSKLLPKCRTLVAAEDWQAVAALTADEASVLRQPQLLLFRLQAAKSLAMRALFED